MRYNLFLFCPPKLVEEQAKQKKDFHFYPPALQHFIFFQRHNLLIQLIFALTIILQFQALKTTNINMVTCHIKYVIDPFQLEVFEQYGKKWVELVNRFG